MKIAICDDDEYYQDLLKKMVDDSGVCSQLDIYASANALLSSKKTYDVLLLDIELQDIDGITLSKEFVFENVYIIFVSAHKERVYDAFGIHIHAFISKEDVLTRLPKSLTELAQIVKNRFKVAFEIEGAIQSFYEDEIMCFQYFNRCTTLYTKNNCFIIKGKTFQEVEDSLSSSFVKINRSEIVNVSYIKTIDKQILKLAYTNRLFTISRDKYKDVKNLYMKWMLNYV